MHNIRTLFLVTSIGWSVMKLKTCRVECIAGGQMALEPPSDEAIVFINSLNRRARLEGVRSTNSGFYTFRGIRYASAVKGPRRFQRSKLLRLEGDLFATLPCQPCPQPDPYNSSRGIIGDEDCLCLNVYTPKMPDESEGLPVLFWIHGGGFRRGSASYYGGKYLNARGAILVTIQYRLGTLGFLSSGTKDMPGNVGIVDMITALQWVEEYIGFFGGDPGRILTFGQGSGASAAMLLAVSSTRPRPAGVIALSGTALSRFALDPQPNSSAALVAARNNCPLTPAKAMVDCLRRLPLNTIVTSDSFIEKDYLQTEGFIAGLSGALGTAPVVDGQRDGRSLPTAIERQPYEAIQSSALPPIPLLTGVTKNELHHAILGIFNDELRTKLSDDPIYLKTRFLDDLKTLLPKLDFLKMESLRMPTINLTANIIDDKIVGIPLNFQNYFEGLFPVEEALNKIIDAAGDVIFNLPAFLSAELWSVRGAAFMYSFDHVGRKTKGSHFLPGHFLAGRADGESDASAHGDELAYIFEPLDLDGNSIEEADSRPPIDQQSALDDKVTFFFTDLISQFANKGAMTLESGEFPPFKGTQEPFLSISTTPKVENNFRYCEMGLWANIAGRLTSSACSLLGAVHEGVGDVAKSLLGTVVRVGPTNPAASTLVPPRQVLPADAPTAPAVPTLQLAQNSPKIFNILPQL